jgi:hypothetical protein
LAIHEIMGEARQASESVWAQDSGPTQQKTPWSTPSPLRFMKTCIITAHPKVALVAGSGMR